jgi:hypothetical protein
MDQGSEHFVMNEKQEISAFPRFVRDDASGFDWWGGSLPLGFDSIDFALGVEHFEQAVQYARVHQLPNFISFVLGAIGSRELGAMERGFIDALSRKAAVGIVPLLDHEAMSNPTMLEGYECAKLFLECRDAAIIRDDIECTMQADHRPPYAGATLHTYCRAAQLGALH